MQWCGHLDACLVCLGVLRKVSGNGNCNGNKTLEYESINLI